MILLLIVLAILLLILLMKVGVDAAYSAEGVALTVLAGPVRIRLLPKPEKKTEKPKKAKTKKAKKEITNKDEAQKEKVKKPLDLELFLDLAKLGLQALNRFRISLRVDRFYLRFISGSDDPYRTAMNCAYARAALNLLAPQAKRAFKVRDSRIELGTDFMAEKPQIDARLALTIAIWRILYVALTACFAFLFHWWRHKKRMKAKAAAGGVKTASSGKSKETAPAAGTG